MSEQPKRRIVLKLDLQADSWAELEFAMNGIMCRLFGEIDEDGPVSVVSGGVGSGHILTVTVNRDQTAEGYQRDLAAYVAEVRR
jgi:hypothetical protein